MNNDNKDSGFIALYRSLTKWEWYTDSSVKDLFLHCIIKANHEDKNWRGKIIKRGSFITSLEHLSRETGLTVKQVRTALSKLKSTGEITHETTSRYSIITVNNYNKYQDYNPQEGNQRANEGQAKGNQRATTNKENKENNITSEQIERKENTSYFLKERNFSAESTITYPALNTKENTPLAEGYCSGTETQESADGCAAKKTQRFIPPQLSAVERYCNERQNGIDPQKFVDFYEARGWMMNKTKMKDWKAAVRTWENQDKRQDKKALTRHQPNWSI